MQFKKFDLVTEGSDDWYNPKIGTIACQHEDDAGEANPRYLVTWHKRADRKYPEPSCKWVRSEYLYRFSPRVPPASVLTEILS
jgi:hypothetical protein